MSEKDSGEISNPVDLLEVLYLKSVELDEEEEDIYTVSLHPEDMKKIGLNPEDVIELEGRFKSAGIVFPDRNEDFQKGCVKLSARTLTNCQAEYGEILKVRNPQVFNAKKVTLAPYKLNLSVNRKFPRVIRRNLEGYPITLYDLITISKEISKEIEFVVTSIEPNEVCIVDRTTKITIDTSLTTQIKLL